MAALSPEDARAIEAAFEAAQSRTSAPLICVLAEASADYAAAPLAASVPIALLAPWPLLIFTQISAERIFAIQLALALIALAVFSVLPCRVFLSGKQVRRAHAHRAAIVQFATRIGAHPHGGEGVLIYVSLAERYARVVAGPEASHKAPAANWQKLIDRLTAGIAKGELKTALSQAAAEAADMLAPHFPPSAGGVATGTRFHSA